MMQRDSSTPQTHHVRIIAELRRTPAGLTADYVRQTCGHHAEAVIQLLHATPTVAVDSETQTFVYKSDSNIGSIEQLRFNVRLKRIVPIGNDLIQQPPYPELLSDIQLLREQGELFLIVHGSKNKENWNLYASPINFQELGLKVEPSEFLKQLWNNTTVIKKPTAFIELRNFLKELGQPLANLRCNVTPEITKAPTEKRKVSKPRARKRAEIDDSTSMSLIARALQGLFSFGTGNENGTKLPATYTYDEDDEDDEQARAEAQRREFLFLHHNRDADPEEFDNVSQLFIIMARWFYGDAGAVIMEQFMNQKLQNGTKLPSELGDIPRKIVDTTLATMKSHQLLVEHPFEQKGQQGPGFSFWACDLNTVLDALNYRICSIRKFLVEYINAMKTHVLSCSKCNRNFTSTDMAHLTRTSKSYTCPACANELTACNNKARIHEYTQHLKEFETFTAPCVEMIGKLLNRAPAASSSSVPQTPGSYLVPRTPLSSSTLKRPGQATSASASRLGSSKRTSALNTPRSTAPTPIKLEGLNSAAPTPVKEEPMQVDEVIPPFSDTPLLFDPDLPRDVFLMVWEDPERYKLEKAYHLAKTLLDDTAEFVDISMRAFPAYGLPDPRKFYRFRFGFESLYLATKRGYRPTEIIRLLLLLTSDETLNPRLMKLIMEEDNYKSHFHVVVQLLAEDAHTSRFWLCSRHLDKMTKLMGIGGIRTMVDTKYYDTFVQKGDYPYCVALTIGAHGPIRISSQEATSHTVESIKNMALRIGIHIIDEFDFSQPSRDFDEMFDIHLRGDGAGVREYQKVALERIFWDPFKAHSGLLILPCGAGKTLIGISVMAALKRPTIIFCQSAMAVAQWKDQVTRFTNLSKNQVVRFSSAYTKSGPMNVDAPVIISTYSMFASKDEQTKRSATSAKMINHCRLRRWGLILLDEVHQAPADVFSRVTNGFKAHVKLGLTATLVREDDKILSLGQLVGPKLFELDIFTLRMQRHISVVECHEIRCPMSTAYQALYDSASSHEEKRLLFTTNLNKVRVCATLIRRHMAQGHKIMVFCDDLFGLKWYSIMLGKRMLQGETHTAERTQLIDTFKRAKGGDCLLFSRVGDQSIDLPQANVVIQIALMQGSRMQELQRVGRVQRPAQGKSGAWFYSLVSMGTDEAGYADRRRGYLEEHGYDVRVHNPVEDFASFLDDESQTDAQTSKLTGETMETLERLMGVSIKKELSERSERNKRKKKGEATVPDDVFKDVLSAIGIKTEEPAPEVPQTPAKKTGLKRKTPETTTPSTPGTPASTAAQLAEAGFATPAPKRAKVVTPGFSKSTLKWAKQANRK